MSRTKQVVCCSPAGLILFVALAFASLAVAEKASWSRYPAISPDGSTIAFSAMGEVWLVPAEGGRARALTRDDGLDTRPVWFADGKRIAFASDRNGNFDVYVIAVDGGSPERWTWHSADDLPWAVTAEGRVLFSSGRTDPAASRLFPGGYPRELYSTGGPDDTPHWEGVPQVDQVALSPSGELLYERVKDVEDEFRKHQTSSAARDIWLRDASGSHQQLTTEREDDREPVWNPAGDGWYRLSERDGCLNVWHRDPAGRDLQLTFHEGHPARSLSVSRDGLLCYSQAGKLWTLEPGRQPAVVNMTLEMERRADTPRTMLLEEDATEAVLSPDGREVAFIVRGEVFVCSVEYGTTRRITDTPEQERNPGFAPDGRSLYYAGERSGSWNLYRSVMPDSSDKHFHSAIRLKEEAVLVSDEDTFQPRVSPDGRELAYLAQRIELRVMNLESRKSRVVVPQTVNYSYTDDDQWYRWSPDSQWFVLHFLTKARWMDEVGLVSAQGGEIHNLTLSGYSDFVPRWSTDGNAVYFLSDQQGLRSHGSWGSEDDIHSVHLNRAAWEQAQLSPEEFAATEPEMDEDEERLERKQSRGFFGWFRRTAREEGPERIVVDLQDIDLRRDRLTERSTWISDFQPSLDGKLLYVLARYSEDLELFELDPRTKEMNSLMSFGARRGELMPQVREGELVLLLSGGRLLLVKPDEESQEDIPWRAELRHRQAAEWDYLFEHIWRQVREKFYHPDLHGADWERLHDEYAAFLPAIDHKRDFAECMSEMLGELNASHTGCFLGGWREENDSTADLGLLFDPAYPGPGLRVTEILRMGPFDRSDSRLKPGMILTSISGKRLVQGNPWRLLNRLSNDPVAVGFREDGSETGMVERVKPASPGTLRELLYQRWVRRNREEVETASGGRLGYVHVREMDDASFRVVYHEALGRYADAEGLVVDSRHNGGGWLTDDLVVFLSGRRTYRSVVRPGFRVIGEEPFKSWNRPSIVLMDESNYSDAHMFPHAYKDNGVGRLVGMPVAGTGTAVWWEDLMDGELVFGIPQVGIIDETDAFLENQQLEPDLKVDNLPGPVLAGRDEQLETAVKALLEELDATD